MKIEIFSSNQNGTKTIGLNGVWTSTNRIIGFFISSIFLCFLFPSIGTTQIKATKEQHKILIWAGEHNYQILSDLRMTSLLKTINVGIATKFFKNSKNESLDIEALIATNPITKVQSTEHLATALYECKCTLLIHITTKINDGVEIAYKAFPVRFGRNDLVFDSIKWEITQKISDPETPIHDFADQAFNSFLSSQSYIK
jgi:hypothetical protein